ncbi:MAG: hypothetical protein ACYC21_07630 [Eubacteriales bacterium]
MLENGQSYCTCSKTKCERHGKCSECIDYHKKGENCHYVNIGKPFLQNGLGQALIIKEIRL